MNGPKSSTQSSEGESTMSTHESPVNSETPGIVEGRELEGGSRYFRSWCRCRYNNK